MTPLDPSSPSGTGRRAGRRAAGLLLLGAAAGGAALAAVARGAPGRWRQRPAGPGGPFSVVLDAGHGGRDPGAISPLAPVVEKTTALRVALLTGDALRRRGIGVFFTRSDDRLVPLAERAALAGRSGAALLLSLHLNAAADPAVRGAEAWHGAGQDDAALAGATLAGLSPALTGHGTGTRGPRPGPGLAVLHAGVPAVLMELGYLTNPHEASLLARPAYLERLAEGLADGVAHFRGGSAVAPAPAPAPEAPAVGAAPVQRYRVRPGDTLSGIALRHGVSLDALLAVNRLEDPHRIVAGTTLVIPAAGP